MGQGRGDRGIYQTKHSNLIRRLMVERMHTIVRRGGRGPGWVIVDRLIPRRNTWLAWLLPRRRSWHIASISRHIRLFVRRGTVVFRVSQMEWALHCHNGSESELESKWLAGTRQCCSAHTRFSDCVQFPVSTRSQLSLSSSPSFAHAHLKREGTRTLQLCHPYNPRNEAKTWTQHLEDGEHPAWYIASFIRTCVLLLMILFISLSSPSPDTSHSRKSPK